jgi:hypothetical protein
MRNDIDPYYNGPAYVPPEPPPEERIATMVREDLGVTVNPQALRMFIRTRWARLSKAAHEIHDGR